MMSTGREEPVSLPGRWSLYGDIPWRALCAGVRGCPWFLESLMIAIWATVIRLIAAKPSRAIRANLRRIVPEAGPVRREWLLWRTFYLFGSVSVDSVRYSNGENVLSWEVEGMEHYRAAAKQSRPVVVFTAHMGSYDAAAAVFAGIMGRRLHAVRRPERHPAMQKAREAGLRRMGTTGFQPVYNTGESVLAVELMRALDAGEWVAIQGDRALPGLSTMICEDAGGLRWRIPRGPFVLTLASKAVCLPAFVRRTGFRRYRVTFHPPQAHPVPAPPGRETAVTSLAKAWLGSLAAVIREDPAQWLVFEPAFPDDAGE